MKEHPNMVIKQEVFDAMIDSAVALVKELRTKEEAKEPITKAEADFVNAFEEYARVLTAHVKENLLDKKEGEPWEKQ